MGVCLQAVRTCPICPRLLFGISKFVQAQKSVAEVKQGLRQLAIACFLYVLFARSIRRFEK